MGGRGLDSAPGRSDRSAPSSRGQGHRPLTAKTRVRIPVGSLPCPLASPRRAFSCQELEREHRPRGRTSYQQKHLSTVGKGPRGGLLFHRLFPGLDRHFTTLPDEASRHHGDGWGRTSSLEDRGSASCRVCCYGLHIQLLTAGLSKAFRRSCVTATHLETWVCPADHLRYCACGAVRRRPLKPYGRTVVRVTAIHQLVVDVQLRVQRAFPHSRVAAVRLVNGDKDAVPLQFAVPILPNAVVYVESAPDRLRSERTLEVRVAQIEDGAEVFHSAIVFPCHLPDRVGASLGPGYLEGNGDRVFGRGGEF